MEDSMNKIQVSTLERTDYNNGNGVYQDGVLAYAVDRDGLTWGLLGHTNMGGISVWRGDGLENMKKLYKAEFLFQLGEAGHAFYGSCYPDGPFARGGIWPCGLWIDSSDQTFYCFVHNETGWEAGASAYTIFGQQEGEPDYRHIGLIKSKDRGRTWDFVDWIITSGCPSFSSFYAPDGITGGQEGNIICLCSGDFSILPNNRDGYLYIFYTQSFYDCINGTVVEDNIYVARSLLSEKGKAGSWFKYYQGAFSEPGNCGRETPIVYEGAVPSVYYDEYHDCYIMSSYHRKAWMKGECTCRLQISNNLTDWREPVFIAKDRPDLSKPYFTLYFNQKKKRLQLFMESNGTNVESAFIDIDDENLSDNGERKNK
jgi:hypothetical protein